MREWFKKECFSEGVSGREGQWMSEWGVSGWENEWVSWLKKEFPEGMGLREWFSERVEE